MHVRMIVVNFVLFLLLAQVAAAASPDLAATSVSASPSIIAPGDPLTIRAKVENQGDGDAGYFRTGFYLSTDQVISTNDIQIGSPKGNETAALKAGESEPFTYRTNLISAPAGIYYLGAIADYRDQVPESNEKNNSLAGNQILIAASEPVAAGSGHSMALKPDGGLWAWGLNSYGQLGDGKTSGITVSIHIGEKKDWVAVSAGLAHTLALKSDGSLWAWGSNFFGQLGDGTTEDKTSPVRIGKDNDWTFIEAGDYHSVGLKSDGTLWAWGLNSYGQLGDGTTKDKNAPVRIGKDDKWARVSAGAFHTVGLGKDMTLWAWGNNSHGQLGDNTTSDRSEPVRIGTDSRWSAVSAGEYHTVALNWCKDCWTSNSLWAWGSNEHGQLGNGSTENKPAPVQIGTDKTWVKVSAGSNHAAALKKDGTLWAWGRNTKGQLGDGTTKDKSSPVRVGMDTKWVSISAGATHTLAMKADDSLWSWGANDHGQLGDGGIEGKKVPTRVK